MMKKTIFAPLHSFGENSRADTGGTIIQNRMPRARYVPASAPASGHMFVRALALCMAFAFALIAIAPAPLKAQDDPAQNSDYLDALRQCRQIEEGDARLACYDLEVNKVIAASEKGDVQIVKKEEVEKTRRGLFGFTMPKIGLFASKGDELNLLKSKITRVRAIRRGWILTIEEGSVWRLDRVPARLRTPKVGDPIVFKKAALGSYFVRIDGQIGVKGKRIE